MFFLDSEYVEMGKWLPSPHQKKKKKLFVCSSNAWFLKFFDKVMIYLLQPLLGM